MTYDLVILWKIDNHCVVHYIYPNCDNDNKPRIEYLDRYYDGTGALEDLKAASRSFCNDEYKSLDEIFEFYFENCKSIARDRNEEIKYYSMPNEKTLQKYYDKFPSYSLITIMKLGN